MVRRENYLLVKEHLAYLQEVCQLAPASIHRYRAYLNHLLRWADEKPFNLAASFRPAFPAYVSSLPGVRGEKNLSGSSQKKTIETARTFFRWAKMAYEKDFERLPVTWIDTLRPPRLKQASNEHVFVTVDEAIKFATYPVNSDDLSLRRDQAAAAMLFLSGMRAGAFTTLPIEAVDIPGRMVRQWPELGVETKNGKRATTYFLPIQKLVAVVQAWDEIVRNELSPTSRWYAPVKNKWGVQTLSDDEPGKNRMIALNKRLRILAETVGLTYYSAHKFRHGNAVYGLQHAQTMADYKAVSMNLMHEDVRITDQIYAPLLSNEVKHRIAGLSAPGSPTVSDSGIKLELGNLSNNELVNLLQEIAKRLSS